MLVVLLPLLLLMLLLPVLPLLQFEIFLLGLNSFAVFRFPCGLVPVAWVCFAWLIEWSLLLSIFGKNHRTDSQPPTSLMPYDPDSNLRHRSSMSSSSPYRRSTSWSRTFPRLRSSSNWWWKKECLYIHTVDYVEGNSTTAALNRNRQ